VYGVCPRGSEKPEEKNSVADIFEQKDQEENLKGVMKRIGKIVDVEAVMYKHKKNPSCCLVQ